jgi:hypothetical protein
MTDDLRLDQIEEKKIDCTLTTHDLAILINHYSKEVGIENSTERLKYFTLKLAGMLK